MTKGLLLHIKYYLLKNKRYTIPGVGSLLLEKKSAYFSEDKKTLFPPSYKINFNNNKDSDQSYTEEELKLSHYIKAQIEKYNYAAIPYFGNFYSIENDNFSFKVNEDFLNSYNQSLQPIEKLQMVDKTFVGGHEGPETNTLVVKKEKSKIEINKILPYLISAIILGLLVYLLTNLKIPISNDKPIPEKVSEEYARIKMEKARQDSINRIAAYRQDSIANAETKKIQDSIRIEDSITKAESDKMNEKFIADVKKQKGNKTIDKKPKPIVKKDTSEVQWQSLMRASKGPCAIITGVYQSNENVILMTNKLKKMGYEVYTEQTDSLTRVGIKYDCTNPKIDRLLDTIRKKIIKESWILK